jgi:hypothetical protein
VNVDHRPRSFSIRVVYRGVGIPSGAVERIFGGFKQVGKSARAIWRSRAEPEYSEKHYREKQDQTLVDKYRKAADKLSVVNTYRVVSPSAPNAVVPAKLFLYTWGNT